MTAGKLANLAVLDGDRTADIRHQQYKEDALPIAATNHRARSDVLMKRPKQHYWPTRTSPALANGCKIVVTS
jgi:hypothetical protein